MPVISYANIGAATTVPGQADTYDLGAILAEWRRMYLGNQADALQFGTSQDIALGRVAADILGLGAGDTLRIASDGGLEIGTDVRLTRGAANRLDLAAGDRLNLLAGLLDLGDAAADPAAAGEFRRNGADLKGYSGGAVRNMSDVHAALHTAASHSDQVATGAELDALRGGGETSLHSHASGALKLGIFGDGSDGAVTISSTTTLTRDMYYSTLTVDATFNLMPDGYFVFVSGTLTNNGTIHAKGNDGVAGTREPTNPGGAAGGGLTGNRFGGAGAGGAGADTASGVAGAAGSGIDPSLHAGNGGAGGKGGENAPGGTAGGAAGAATDVAASEGLYRSMPELFRPWKKDDTILKGGAGGGGGGVSNGGASVGGSGGGGGGGASLIIIIAFIVVNNGAITTDGGGGGNGGPSTFPKWTGGGGGGGGGGATVLVTTALSGLGTLTAAGGAPGAAGVGDSGGAGPSLPGIIGAAGTVISLAG